MFAAGIGACETTVLTKSLVATFAPPRSKQVTTGACPSPAATWSAVLRYCECWQALACTMVDVGLTGEQNPENDTRAGLKTSESRLRCHLFQAPRNAHTSFRSRRLLTRCQRPCPADSAPLQNCLPRQLRASSSRREKGIQDHRLPASHVQAHMQNAVSPVPCSFGGQGEWKRIWPLALQCCSTAPVGVFGKHASHGRQYSGAHGSLLVTCKWLGGVQSTQQACRFERQPVKASNNDLSRHSIYTSPKDKHPPWAKTISKSRQLGLEYPSASHAWH